MDPSFEIGARQRSVAPLVEADATPVTLAWHAQSRWEGERAQQRQALQEAWKSAQSAWIALADEYHRLTGIADRLRPVLEEVGESEALKALEVMVARLGRCLSDAGVECVRPEGDAFTLELGEYFESVAQRQCPETTVLIVLDVVEPAIVMQGALIRQGKAVIGIPTGDGQS